MEYQSIILELMMRVQKLEEEVERLKNKSNIASPQKMTTDDIRKYILDIITKSETEDVVLVSGEIHKALPIKNSMPMVCNAMYSLAGENDEVLERSPSGYSSTLKIKYKKRQ